MLYKSLRMKTNKCKALFLLTAMFFITTCVYQDSNFSILTFIIGIWTGKKTFTPKQLENYLMKNCDADTSNFQIQTGNSDTLFIPISVHKKNIAFTFHKMYGNPQGFRQEISELLYDKEKSFTSPRHTLYDPSEAVEWSEIDIELRKDKQQRLKKGDRDVLQIPEVMEELHNTKYNIPNLIHFIWLGKGRRFEVDHYIALIGALRFQRPKVILFHHDSLPVGEYWEAVKKIARHMLKLVKRTLPTEARRNRLVERKHMLDVLRLQILIETGGILLNIESVIVDSIDSLRHFPMVQDNCNSNTMSPQVLLAHRDSWFLHRWYHEYKYYKLKSFDSTKLSWAIQQYHSTEAHMVKDDMFRPCWNERHLFYTYVVNWDRTSVVHLFARADRHRYRTNEPSLKQLAVLNTTYGEIARHVIWGDMQIMDITDWIVTCNLTKILLDGLNA